jgi:hypothetical protein
MKKLKVFFFTLITIVLVFTTYAKYHKMNINDIGLKVLAWVKKLKGDSVDLESIDNATTDTMNHELWNELLLKHVSADGRVDYKGFRKETSLLQTYLSQLSSHVPGKNWTEKEKLAYWINAYNAFTVKLIIDHYPLKSIKDIGDGLPMISSPWDIKFFKIGDQDFDLNTIEHEILRKNFDEPRIHFAINCASFSCPVLRNEAFNAVELEKQLEEQTIGFLKNTDKNILSATENKQSPILDWFQSDFKKYGTVNAFIKKYIPDFNENNKIEYLEYDWTLNE